MATKSPRRTPQSKQAQPDLLSPTRASRLEEQQTLQGLNRRLESYILRQRERDASQGVLERELDELRKLHQQEMEHAKSSWDEQIKTLRHERDEASSQFSALKHEHESLLRELNDAQTDLAQKDQDIESLEDKLEAQTKARAEAEVTMNRTQDELRKTTEERDHALRKARELDGELKATKNATKEDSSRARIAEGKVNGLVDDLRVLKTTTDEQIARLRGEVQRLTSEKGHAVDDARKAFADQLNAIVAEKKEEFEAQKEKDLEDLKAYYDTTLVAYRSHLERAGHELADMKEKLKSAVAQSQDMKEKLDDAQAEHDGMRRHIQELQADKEALKNAPKQEVAELKEIIKRIKASFKRKDREFDELIDLKIRLDAEIRQYAKMLEKEEERLGYGTPLPGGKKKRKRALDGDDEKGAAASSAADDAEEDMGEATAIDHMDEMPALIFSGMDVHGLYVTVRNQSITDVALKNWSLQTEVTKLLFEFPEDSVLGPGKSITVWTGPEAAEHENPPSDVAWSHDVAVFAESGDTCMLVNEDNFVVAERKIIPTKPDLAGPAHAAAGAEPMDDIQKQKGVGPNGEKQECLVM